MRNGTGLGWMLLALLTGGCGMGKPTKGAPGNALPSAPAGEAPPAVAGGGAGPAAPGGAGRALTESEAYIAERIHLHVWSGLYDVRAVHDMITQLMEPDADEAMLRARVDQERRDKWAAEQSWPAVTDVERLQAVYAAVREQGVLVVPNAGWDGSEAFHTTLSVYKDLGAPPALFGMAYHTAQDVDRAVRGEGLYLGFGSTRPEDEERDALRAGETLRDALVAAGFPVEWDGSVEQRMKVAVQWQVRGATAPAPAADAPPEGSGRATLQMAVRLVAQQAGGNAAMLVPAGAGPDDKRWCHLMAGELNCGYPFAGPPDAALPTLLAHPLVSGVMSYDDHLFVMLRLTGMEEAALVELLALYFRDVLEVDVDATPLRLRMEVI